MTKDEGQLRHSSFVAITCGIIKMHRGQITMRSQVGQGTTFIIQLPVTLPPTSGLPTTAIGGEHLIGSSS